MCERVRVCVCVCVCVCEWGGSFAVKTVNFTVCVARGEMRE